ncbi:uncharacterized protein LOC110706495 [Chenopodium quinoa]|uniref:uncharacterized protein LOC110706495 n=1 Tax=Chenopodium quinoa TaxID=63459 RepID=UPI000B78D673|nr:uncharacterized protein LOC110706495 [Chenopodium quinoa]
MIKTGFQCPINSRFYCIECNNHFCSICMKRLKSKTRRNTVNSEISEEPPHTCEETEFTQKRKIIRNLSTRFFSYYKAWENFDKEMFELNSDMAVIQSLPESVGFFPVEINNLSSYLTLVTQSLDILKSSYIFAYYHQRLQGEKDVNKLQYEIEKCCMSIVDLVRSLSAVDMKAEDVKKLWILLENQ